MLAGPKSTLPTYLSFENRSCTTICFNFYYFSSVGAGAVDVLLARITDGDDLDASPVLERKPSFMPGNMQITTSSLDLS